ncbi:MAG: glycosyltransferase family 4 protein [Promethearchaeia archaeon]
MKKKTIGFFNIEFPAEKPFHKTETYRGGGAGKSLLDMIVNLSPEKYNLIIFSVGTKNEVQIEYIKPNLMLIRYPVIGKKLFRFLPMDQNNISLRFMMDPLKIKLDLIHCQLGYHGADIPALLYKYFYDVPLVLSLRGVINPVWATAVGKLLLKFYKTTTYKKLINMSDRIVIQSKPILSMIPYLPKVRKKVEIIPNGVDFNMFSKYYARRPTEKLNKLLKRNENRYETIFLFVGSLFKRKGVHILFEAYQELLKDCKKSLLIIVGEGPLGSVIRKEMKERNLEKNIRLTGYIKNQDLMAQIYALSDLLILPSVGEGFPRVILESMAAGTPCLVSNTPPNAAAIADGSLGLIAERDPQDLEEKMKKFIEMPEKTKKSLQKRCHNYAKQFKWSSNAKEMEKIYDKLLD